MSKLTLDMLRTKNIAFFPASEGEARQIQKILLRFGLRWKSGAAEITNTAACVSHGIALIDGVIYTHGDGDNRQYMLATLQNLMPAVDDMRDLRLAALEKEIAALKGEVTAAPRLSLGRTGGPKP